MRNQIPVISVAKPPALTSAAVPTAEAARRAVDSLLAVCTQPSQWRSAPVYASAAAAVPTAAGLLPISAAQATPFAGAGTGVGVSGPGKTDVSVYVDGAEQQHARTETSTNLQDQTKLRLMSRRDLRTWKPPS